MRDPRQRFTKLIAQPDGQIDLGVGALLVAAEVYPALDVDFYLAELDARAAELRPAVESGRSDRDRALRLIHGLHGVQGFAGNRREYHDPRNSYLNEVLESRTGIPITLCLVYIEVARRLDIPIQGVGFPGHFLARYAGDELLIIDAFHGCLLSREDCEKRLRESLGPDAELKDEHLIPARPREILRRLLSNLKAIHVQAAHWERALSCCDRLVLLCPDDAFEVRDRGLVYEKLDCFTAAHADLERFLELAPENPSAGAIRRQLEVLSRRKRSIN